MVVLSPSVSAVASLIPGYVKFFLKSNFFVMYWSFSTCRLSQAKVFFIYHNFFYLTKYTF